MAKQSDLAINGGPQVRPSPLPYRKLFDEDVLKKITEVFENSWKEGVDFGFQNNTKRFTPTTSVNSWARDMPTPSVQELPEFI